MEPFMHLRPSDPLPPKREYANSLEGLVSLLADASTVTALTGAGISTASGLPDFRGKGGLWENCDPMVECSLSAFQRDEVRFWRFYSDRLAGYEGLGPNAAHQALVDLERMGKLRWVLTQNIDGLHQMAGSTQVVELHGSPRTVSCLRCGFATSWDKAMQLRDESGVPRCPHQHAMKPDVVLFEENLPNQPFQQAHLALASSDVLLCLGSSLVVHPVAGFPALMRRGGGHVVIVNQGWTPEDPLAEIKLEQPLEEVLPAAVAALQGTS